MFAVPIYAGGPKPQTGAQRHEAIAREARAREELEGLREHALRGAVRGALWSTLLALALLRTRYAAARLAWIPLEARAFAWLEGVWPPPTICPLSPASAILRISALLV